MTRTAFLGALAFAGLSAGATCAATVDDVIEQGVLKCGTNAGLTGFSEQDATGRWNGFDVALCRAVAAAVLGDPEAVEFIPTTPATHFTSLKSGEVDLLVRNTTWTFSNDVDEKFTFLGVNYYDAQGFLVPKELGVSSAKELDGATVCVLTENQAEQNLAEYFATNNMEYTVLPFESHDEAQQKYLDGDCHVYSTAMSVLAASRATFETPGDHALLPEAISKEPLGPMVRHGDDEWADIVRWTLNALITAEEQGVTSTNVVELADGTENAEINRLLGVEGSLGAMLGLEPDWALKAIMAVGNYGEIFEKNIGEATPIGLPRGLNAQWLHGGLLYAQPFR